ncbi:MAG: Gfo/Idh/MocA family oxidoreductase [Armatimonadetes bacterium]|jgi:UDP-N-acetyl-2-amino-2-deoxyglucuronate dehydrogenase|nr:Gfo/Idh/MocA family oxidoreductase [Armatimonadota bacterium]
MANRVRFAIVGTGMGSDRARKAANTPGAELVAVCSLDVAGGQRLATELGCDFVADYDTLLAREDVDVVGVMTPSGWHCDFAIRALRAGKHAFTTKPMDLRLEKCDEAIRAAQETGRILAVDFESRYLPVNHQVRQAIRSGRLGKVFSVDLRMKWYREQSYYDGGTPAGWRSRLETEGGSAANQAIHYLDLLLWWLGPVQTVQGRYGTFTHAIETEDNTQALVTFASGAWGVFQTSTSVFPDLGTAVEIAGEQGLLAWRDGQVTLFRTKTEEAPALDVHPVDPALPPHIIADMVAAITQGRRPMCPAEEGRRSVAFLCALYESARTGRAISL